MALYWAKYLFGLIEEGDTPVDEMRPLQPWPTGEYAEALELGAGR